MKFFDGKIFLVLLVITFLGLHNAFLWRRRRRRLPPVKRPPVRAPVSKTPYCPLDARIKSIIDKKRVGREIEEFKRRTRPKWPYNCLHASILEDGGGFTIFPLIFSCCNSCNFPAFTTCNSIYHAGPNWRCPSQGMQCIVKCVTTYKPPTIPTTQKPTTTSRRRRFRFTRLRARVTVRRVRRLRVIVKPKPKNPKCERKVKKGGKYCIERLCIPIKLT